MLQIYSSIIILILTKICGHMEAQRGESVPQSDENSASYSQILPVLCASQRNAGHFRNSFIFSGHRPSPGEMGSSQMPVKLGSYLQWLPTDRGQNLLNGPKHTTLQNATHYLHNCATIHLNKPSGSEQPGIFSRTYCAHSSTCPFGRRFLHRKKKILLRNNLAELLALSDFSLLAMPHSSVSGLSPTCLVKPVQPPQSSLFGLLHCVALVCFIHLECNMCRVLPSVYVCV